MAATETRLLLLGAVLLFEPVNGYQVRRELLSWRVEDWAHVNPGSIYSGLATLARRGHLHRHDLVDGGREVAVYTSTDDGRAEFARLWGRAVEDVRLLDPLPFQTAMTLLPLVERERALRHLRARQRNGVAARRERDAEKVEADVLPPHVAALAELWRATDAEEAAWLDRLVIRIERGDLEFAGEPEVWQAPDDDPGWQMVRDQERYRELLRDDR
ncbi:MAG: PadR family transcriptional regulator [Dermatophilaceae bacterium]